MAHDRELEAVLGWLEGTDRIALEFFGGDVDTDTKADGTPVTVADRLIEERLRGAIEKTFAGDAILGEEMGESGSSGRRWIIDPIDGTKNFARGIPIFGTLVALEDEGGLAVGVASAPALRLRWWATRGGGAFRDGETIRVSEMTRVADAHVSSGSLSYADDAHLEGFVRLARSCSRSRAFGDFWGHMLVAQGSIDVMVEFAPLAVWDIAAPKIIVEEAGGRATDLDGDATLRPGPLVTTNGLAHAEVLELLSG